MKIILCNKYFYPRGGDCIHTLQLKQLLEAHGHEVAIFSMQFAENYENQYSSYWPKEVDFNNKALKNLISAFFRPFGSTEVKYKWNRLLKDFNPDAVHLHNIHSQLSPIIAKECRKLNVPVLWTLHDHKLVCPAYLCMDNNGQICDSCLQFPTSVIKKKCIKSSRSASILGYLEALKWNRSKLERSVDHFITPSSFLRDHMIRGGYHPRKLVHIYNFISNEKFAKKVNLKRSKNVVFVGRLSREKGIHTLCKAFSSISGNSKLIVIGDGPLKKELKRQYGSANIDFLGHQSWDCIKENLCSASFLVLPSEWYENNPLSVIEAYSQGTPVLGAMIGGIPELINHEVNGMTFSSGDVEDLRTKILKMLEFDTWDYHKIQSEAQVSFSESTYYKKIEKLYTKASKEEHR